MPRLTVNNTRVFPVSNASVRTRFITVFGAFLYIGFLLVSTLATIVAATDNPTKFTSLWWTIPPAILFAYFGFIKPVQTLRKIYKHGNPTKETLQHFIIPTLTGLVSVFFLPLALYNLILAAHTYKQPTTHHNHEQ